MKTSIPECWLASFWNSAYELNFNGKGSQFDIFINQLQNQPIQMMKQNNRYLYFGIQLMLAFGILSLLTSCGDKQKSPELEEAFKIHNEAIKLRETINGQMAQLTANQDSTFIATHGAELKVLSQSLAAWDEQVVEVPGFDHDHDHVGHNHSNHDHSHHDHNHDHDHHHEQELTPKQHLEVQQQLLKELQAVAVKIESIK